MSVYSRQAGVIGGVFFGAALSALLTPLFAPLSTGWRAAVTVLLYAGLMGTGARTGLRVSRLARLRTTVAQSMPEACPKVLDTSVIIDGRIFDICKAGFLEGELIVPTFVLDELRHVADSADALKRARGRRGLDILQKLREELDCPVRVEEWREEDGAEVDVKLLRLARRLNGAVLTNDYNLNKVAGVARVPVLNINELAGALRPVVLPGEEMTVHIVREGKEPGQGVGYLEDGTMVVVENGRRRVGETLEVAVTTVLQTSAGRMIFTRVKGAEQKAM